MKKITIIFLLILSFSYSKEFTINIVDSLEKENYSVKINLEIDENAKLIPFQKIAVDSLGKYTKFKLITAPGLMGTLVDEREVIIFYKTSLTVSGLKIRNLYRVGVARLYDGEEVLDIELDKDYYQNIYSFLEYHNVKKDQVKNLDSFYGDWQQLIIR